MAFDFGTLKQSFFDSDKVMQAVEKGKRRVLSKFGAFVRTRARSSIRKRKKTSEPGQPPSSHAGQLRLIFFSWDDSTKSVVVGPIPFSGKRGEAVAPKLLELGGTTTTETKRGPKTLHYQARPFMQPALEAESPKFAEQFKGMMQ